MPARRNIRKQQPLNTICLLCKEGVEPDYKDHESLLRFITSRNKIMSSDYSGVCTRHQRKLAVAVKRARHLGLLPSSPLV